MGLNMKKFILKGNNSQFVDDVDVEFVIPDHHTLEQVLEQFTLFLKASGYVFDGYCDILEHDDLK